MSWNFHFDWAIDAVGDKCWDWYYWLIVFNHNYGDHWLMGYVVDWFTEPLEGWMHDVANRVDDIESRARDVYAVLDATFRTWVSGDDLQRYVWQLNDFRNNLIRWPLLMIDDIVPGFYLACTDFPSNVPTFICDRWPWTCGIFANPVRWILLEIDDQIPGFYLACTDFPSNVPTFICDRWPWTCGIFTDPGQWIVNRINDWFPGFHYFFEDPVETVRQWIIHGWPALDGLFENPVFWATERLFDRYPAWRTAFEDPGTWFRNSLAWALNTDVNYLELLWGQLDKFMRHPGEFIAEILVDVLGDILENWITTYWNRELPGR